MEIGGTDVIFTVSAELDAVSIAVDRSVAIWPHCIVVDDADGFLHRGNDFHAIVRREREEYLIFRDAAAKSSWEDDGCTDANVADMLQFISRPTPDDAALQEVTLVYFSDQDSIHELVDDVRTHLTSPRTTSPIRSRS